jgi:hypothetical protein
VRQLLNGEWWIIGAGQWKKVRTPGFDFNTAVTRNSDHFLPRMGEQNEADAKENSDGRCRDAPEGDEVEQGADSRFRRPSAPIPGIGGPTRYFGGFRIGGSGRASQYEPLS